MKTSLLLAGALLLGTFAQADDTDISKTVRGYNQSPRSKILALNSLLGVGDLGAISADIVLLRSLGPDGERLADLKRQLKAAVGKFGDFKRLDKHISSGEHPGLEGTKASLDAETEDLKLKIQSLESEISNVEGGILARIGRKSVRLVSTAVGAALVYDVGSRIYVLFIEHGEPSLFPVLDLAADGVDSVNANLPPGFWDLVKAKGSQVIATFTNKKRS